jgi:transcriptional regulator with XRE-family HTH domain
VAAPRVSETVGQQIARARARRGWTQRKLGDELEAREPDTALNRAAVAKIESGVRGVTVDEVVLIAATLDVPPLLLFLPLESGDRVRLASTVEVPAWRAYEWFVAHEPLEDAAAWSTHTAVVRAYERLMAAQDATKTAMYRLESAEALGWDKDRQIADYNDALRDLATAMRDLEEAGASPKALVDRRLAKIVRDRKIEPHPRRSVQLSREA